MAFSEELNFWTNAPINKSDVPEEKLHAVERYLFSRFLSKDLKKVPNPTSQIREALIESYPLLTIHILMNNYDTHYFDCETINPAKGVDILQKSIDGLTKIFPILSTLTNDQSYKNKEGYLACQKKTRDEFKALDQESQDWIMKYMN
jgi:hypothetical protein